MKDLLRGLAGEMGDSKNTTEMTEEEFLAQYRQSDYPRPSFTADVAVFCAGDSSCDAMLLMVKRGGHPYRGCWALPGGFVEPQEDSDSTALRELREETGLEDVSCEQLGVYSKPGRDPRGWTATAAYVALVGELKEAHAGDDAARAIWCPLHVSISDDGRRLIEVEAEGETLRCLFAERECHLQKPRALVIESVGFAFDHAQIVADAFLVVEDELRIS